MRPVPRTSGPRALANSSWQRIWLLSLADTESGAEFVKGQHFESFRRARELIVADTIDRNHHEYSRRFIFRQKSSADFRPG